MASEANWNSFYSDPMPAEDSDEVMAHLFGSDQFAYEQNQDPNIGTQPMFWSDDQNTDSYCSSYYWPSQGNCTTTSSTSSFPYENYFLADLNGTRINDEAEEEEEAAAASLLPHHPHGSLQAKRKPHIDDNEKPPIEGEDCQMECPKKKAKAPSNVAKKEKNVQSKKWHKSASTSNLTEITARSSGGCSSEDDLNANVKTRAGRGSATDPQSLYARKRREKINERLRILQNLVPNGTKVDISTMLEEAVQYVKFLQLQIKLLSSDDLWMYAPLAYNGIQFEDFSPFKTL